VYIRFNEIPADGLVLFEARGKGILPKLLEGVDPAPLEECTVLSARLSLVLREDDLYADGEFAAEGRGKCDLCAEPAAVRFGGTFTVVLIPPSEAPVDSPQHMLHREELEVDFHDGQGVDAAAILREQVLLAIPSGVLCGDGCQGLCPACGGNRNLGECRCGGPKTENPFAVLGKLKQD
jgi:uncharacterized protein